MLSDAPTNEHTPPRSNTLPPHITGHNNELNDDSPITTQNDAPPTNDATTPQNPRMNARRTPTQPPTGSTTTPTSPPDPTHRPLTLPAPPDTATTPRPTPDTPPAPLTHTQARPTPPTHSPASLQRYAACARARCTSASRIVSQMPN